MADALPDAEAKKPGTSSPPGDADDSGSERETESRTKKTKNEDEDDSGRSRRRRRRGRGRDQEDRDDPRDQARDPTSDRAHGDGEDGEGGDDLDGLALLEEILGDDEERPQTYDAQFDDNDLDDDALKIARRLQHNGHAAFLVGGCVRDLLAGKHPKDFDVATSATPRQIKRLFRNCRIIGRRFKLAHVFFRDGKIIELATFRAPPQESKGGDDELLITDDNVFGSPREDAFRRDFTINALMYCPSTEKVIDFVDGWKDIEQRQIRSIGEAEIRFREDPIRILRALKFAARLDYEIDRSDRQAISQHRGDLLKSPMARLLEEVQKILGCGAAAPTFRSLKLTGVLETILPPLDALVESPREGSPLLWKLLEALDVTSGGSRVFSNAVMLACLIYPSYLAASQGDPKQGTFGHISRWLGNFLRGCDLLQQIPRKDKGRLRQMISALPRFRADAEDRRYSIAGFVRREAFADAYEFWKLLVAATGEGAERLPLWEERAQSLGRHKDPDHRGDRDRDRDRDRGRDDRDDDSGDKERGSQQGRAPRAPDDIPDPYPGYKQPRGNAHKPRATGFGSAKDRAPSRSSWRTIGFGADRSRYSMPIGFGDGIESNQFTRHTSLGFGEEQANLNAKAVGPTGGVGFGEDAQYTGKQAKKKKKKLPVIPGVNTPDIVGGRRTKKKRRKSRGGGGGGGGGGRSQSRSGGGGSGGGGGGGGGKRGGRRRRRRRR